MARTRSKLAAATQLYAYSELTLFGNKGLWTVNEAESIEEFRGLRSDLKRLALAGYICELLEAVSDEDCPEPEMLQLGLNCLYALSNRLATRDVVKAVFELRLMCIAGYRPGTGRLRGLRAGGRGFRRAGARRTASSTATSARAGRAAGGPLGAGGHEVHRESRAEEAVRLPDRRRGGERALLGLRSLYALPAGQGPFRSLDYYKKLRDIQDDAI